MKALNELGRSIKMSLRRSAATVAILLSSPEVAIILLMSSS